MSGSGSGSGSFNLSDFVADFDKVTASQIRNTIVSLQKLEISPYLLERFEKVRLSNPRLKVKMVYHGTLEGNIPNIQRKGFLIPGTQGVTIMNGNAYGRGVYVSTCPNMSVGYVRDAPKLLICALLEGDSNVTSHGSIRVVKNSSYVIPCYVLHYEGSPRKSHFYQRVQSNPKFHTFCHGIQITLRLCKYLILGSLLTFTLSFFLMSIYWITGLTEPSYEISSLLFYGIFNVYYAILISIISFVWSYMVCWPAYIIWSIFWFFFGWFIGIISWIFWQLVTVILHLGISLISLVYRMYGYFVGIWILWTFITFHKQKMWKQRTTPVYTRTFKKKYD